jgi:hypothetical protein
VLSCRLHAGDARTSCVQISGAAAVQLDLFFAASHSMEPGRMRFGQLAVSPHPAPTPADS